MPTSSPFWTLWKKSAVPCCADKTQKFEGRPSGVPLLLFFHILLFRLLLCTEERSAGKTVIFLFHVLQSVCKGRKKFEV